MNMKKTSVGIKAKTKFAFILFAFLLMLVYIFGRIAYFKDVHGQEYEAAAKERQINQGNRVIVAARGIIEDRNEQVLARSAMVYNVILDPLQLANRKQDVQERTIFTLCEYFPELDYATLKGYIALNPETGEINLPSHWKILVKGIDWDTKKALEEAGVMSIFFEEESRRVYPLKSTACHLLGFTRGDTQWGIEKYYNDYMAGMAGRAFAVYQNGNRVSYEEYDAQDGDTVITTLDYVIQQAAEEVVAETQALWPSETVAAMVMNPNTGEIYAMAQSDHYDLNNPAVPSRLEVDAAFEETWEAMENDEQMNYLNAMWRNFCISSTYEPGSGYKPLVVAAAIEEGRITANSTFYCGGHMEISGYTINCHLRSGHGMITVEEIMAQSCNMGVIQIAQLLGAGKFYEYQRNFGFGQRTGIDLPGEADAAWLLHSPSSIGASELATMSFGQTFNSTSIQMLVAFASLINGGNVLEPYVVSRIVDTNGNITFENKPTVVRKVLSQKTSDYIRVALKATVEYGTGKRIEIDGYSIGCKTGSAEQGSRSRDDLWTLTHMSYFPVENPQYIILTVMHLPESYADGVQSTAPMTKSLIEKIIKYKNMEPTESGNAQSVGVGDESVTIPNYIGSATFGVVGDLDGRGLRYKVVGTGNTITNQVPKEGTRVAVGSEIILYVERSEEDSGAVAVPNVVGQDYSTAAELLSNAGFEVVFEGERDGRVVRQSPQHGISVAKGSEVKLVLEQQTPADSAEE